MRRARRELPPRNAPDTLRNAGGIAVWYVSSASAAPDSTGYSADISVAEVMESMVMPSAQALWDAVGVDVTEQGEIEIAHAEALHAAAMQALAAVDKRDVDAISEVGGAIDSACESCHLQFWYPDAQ